MSQPVEAEPTSETTAENDQAEETQADSETILGDAGVVAEDDLLEDSFSGNVCTIGQVDGL